MHIFSLARLRIKFSFKTKFPIFITYWIHEFYALRFAEMGISNPYWILTHILLLRQLSWAAAEWSTYLHHKLYGMTMVINQECAKWVVLRSRPKPLTMQASDKRQGEEQIDQATKMSTSHTKCHVTQMSNQQ